MSTKIFKTITLSIGLLFTSSLSFSQSINYAPVQELARIKDTEINEISGVASSYNNPGTFWVHNDSGDSPRIFLVDKSGNTLTVGTIANASANDWEDIASFQLNGTSYLVIADIGDNASARSQYSLYIIEEPKPNTDGTYPSTFPILRRINFTYDTGAQNCESLAVDVQSGKIIMVSKTSYGGTQKIRYVHQLPLSVASGTVTDVAQKIQQFGTIAEATTGMDISNDGRYAIIHTVLDGNFEFTRNQNETWAEAFVKEPRRIGIPEDRGFEAICYGTNGVDLYLMKEGLNSPILFYKGTVNNSITNVSSVAVTPKLASINKTNTLQLAATIAPSDATNPKVIWSSSDPTIATVDSKGLVTAVATGTTKITATTEDGAKTDFSDITVLNPTTLLILQAEDAVLSGAVAAAAQSNWNGTGYADFINNTGDFIKWTVTVPTDGNYELSFRYALGNTARPLELKVNGVVAVASLAFPSTTLWSTWRNVVSIQPLKAGINEIRLTTIGSNGGNIDELQVTNAANLGINQLESLQKKTVNLYPNPYKGGLLSVALSGFEASQSIQLKITNALGQLIHQENLTDTTHNELNLSGRLNEALYFISIEDGSQKVVKKLIVH
jgi:Bacterial Ig-like domain (group 2)/Secretion system C-terminal sorting domain/Carbohydrate binding module (family 35)